MKKLFFLLAFVSCFLVTMNAQKPTPVPTTAVEVAVVWDTVSTTDSIVTLAPSTGLFKNVTGGDVTIGITEDVLTGTPSGTITYEGSTDKLNWYKLGSQTISTADTARIFTVIASSTVPKVYYYRAKIRRAVGNTATHRYKASYILWPK